MTYAQTNQDIPIKKGEKAPFSGRLLDEDTYRWMGGEVLYAQSLDKFVVDEPAVKPPQDSMFLRGLILGILAGGTAAYLLEHK